MPIVGLSDWDTTKKLMPNKRMVQSQLGDTALGLEGLLVKNMQDKKYQQAAENLLGLTDKQVPKGAVGPDNFSSLLNQFTPQKKAAADYQNLSLDWMKKALSSGQVAGADPTGDPNQIPPSAGVTNTTVPAAPVGTPPLTPGPLAGPYSPQTGAAMPNIVPSMASAVQRAQAPAPAVAAPTMGTSTPSGASPQVISTPQQQIGQQLAQAVKQAAAPAAAQPASQGASGGAPDPSLATQPVQGGTQQPKKPLYQMSFGKGGMNVKPIPASQQQGTDLTQQVDSLAQMLVQKDANGKPMLAPSQIPGFGKIRGMVLARARQLDPSFNAVTADIEYQGRSTAARNYSKLYSGIAPAESTFSKNADYALSIVDQYRQTDSPMINKVIQAWRTGVVSDPKTARVIQTINTAAWEYAKITTQNGLQGSMTDDARTHANEMINSLQSNETFHALLDPVSGSMRVDADNRMKSLEEDMIRAGLQVPLTPERAKQFATMAGSREEAEQMAREAGYTF